MVKLALNFKATFFTVPVNCSLTALLLKMTHLTCTVKHKSVIEGHAIDMTTIRQSRAKYEVVRAGTERHP